MNIFQPMKLTTKTEDIKEIYSYWTGRDDATEQEGRITVVWHHLGEAIGVAQLHIMEDKVWHWKWGLIENVFVREEYRRQGVARKMMYTLESIANGEGCKFVRLTTNKKRKAAQKLYRSLGYTEGLSFIKELGNNWVRRY